MSTPYVAEIRIFAGNFAPTGHAFCDGQLMAISQNTALFSLLGTTYGGDGKSTFALPDLEGSAAMHPGQGPGLSLHDLGEQGGRVGHVLEHVGEDPEVVLACRGRHVRAVELLHALDPGAPAGDGDGGTAELEAREGPAEPPPREHRSPRAGHRPARTG